MPSKKKKYNARFPAGRIKKIMQSDEEVGKVAQAVPIIISRTLELFVSSLLQKAMEVTSEKNAKTLTPSHMKQCILSEQRFDFLKELVDSVQDSTNGEDDVGGPTSGVFGTSRSFPPRRLSCSAIREDTTDNEEPALKEKEESTEISKIHMFSSIYSEPAKEQMNQTNIVNSEMVKEPQPNSSTHHYCPNFYSESVPDEKQFSAVIKTEQPQGMTNRSALPFSPSYCPESLSARLTKLESKTEPLPASPKICFSPNFYSEKLPEQRKAQAVTEPPQVMANCSTLRFSPNFYSETLVDDKVSKDRSPTYSSSSVAHHGPKRIAHLTIDEDYDT